jgi:hypothetical protein
MLFTLVNYHKNRNCFPGSKIAGLWMFVFGGYCTNKVYGSLMLIIAVDMLQ